MILTSFENDLKKDFEELFNVLGMVEFKIQEEEKERQWWPQRRVFMCWSSKHVKDLRNLHILISLFFWPASIQTACLKCVTSITQHLPIHR
jgi:hypothetical protein